MAEIAKENVALQVCSKNSRNIMEAILWKLRTGATQRDIFEDLYPRQNAYNRFNRRAIKGLLDKLFQRMRNIVYRMVLIDGSHIRTHQHTSGARHGENTKIGSSRGELTTKIHLATDANGYPLDFEITGGEVQFLNVYATNPI